MWAALVAAVTIGVVWAGGEKALFRAHFPLGWVDTLGVNVYGVRSGLLATNDELLDYSFNAAPQEPFGWQYREAAIWLPSWRTDQYVSWYLRLPYWIPMLPCLMTFALLFRVERRAKRLARVGKCAQCGYDLTGLADGAVCPECGKGKTLT